MYCCNYVGKSVSRAAQDILSQTVHDVDKSCTILMTALIE